MAKARKLPSGAYQTRVTKVIGGKKVTKSFTVHPKECRNDAKKAKQTSASMDIFTMAEWMPMQTGYWNWRRQILFFGI